MANSIQVDVQMTDEQIEKIADRLFYRVYGETEKIPPKVENEQNLFSRNETANKLRISLVKLWQLDKQGLLCGFKIGGKVLYKKEHIEEFINSHTNSSNGK